MVSLIQHFETDFLWKVSLKILNSGIILKTFTHAYIRTMILTLCILMDFPIQINATRMGESIIYSKGSKVGISKL